jgi:hypothetical protein
MSAYTILVIVHVLLFAYWLGADWGVYVNSRYVADAKLPLDERLRFLRAAFRIDLMPRMAFPLLMAVGMQIASFYGTWPVTGAFMIAVWLFALAWLAVNIAGYLRQGTPAGDRMRNIDQYVRLVLAPVLIGVGSWSLVTGAPIAPKFIAGKLIVFGCMIVVGLVLRAIMRNWAIGFRRLATEGPSPEVDALFQTSLGRARYIAYGMWSLSGVMAILGIAKPL